MRHLQMLGLAATAALSLWAFVGAGAALATKLCADSSCTKIYSTGTSLKLSLKSGTSATFKEGGGGLLDTCTGSTINGTTSNSEGGFITTFGEELTWSGCSNTTDTSSFPSGSLDLEWVIAASGRVKHTGNPVTMSLFGVSCMYEGFEGTLASGSPAALSISSSTMTKVSGGFLCPGFVFFSASYTVTSPQPLYIAS
jgi:hypothetical protein